MSLLVRLQAILRGRVRDPMRYETWRAAALVAVLAWAGVGADSLSSANYGPEEAYHVLEGHEPLILWLALLTALTVFLISAAYAQIIALFPSGGGGYQAATRLVHPVAGLISGSALIVDYALTIAISIAAAADAVLNLAPQLDILKPFIIGAGLAGLTALNLRGVRETVSVLAPVFFAFLATHAVLIVAGLTVHARDLDDAMVAAGSEFAAMSAADGVWVPMALIAVAYAAGAGTYTGIEALSNNAHLLKPPRARTGARAMALIAITLALMAGGIMLLYAIWHPVPEVGRTLNGVVFDATLVTLFPQSPAIRDGIMLLAMSSAALLLLVAANAGFLGGPAVLAAMAIDRWAPRSFAHLSSRLVAQQGVLTMAGSAALLLMATGGAVRSLVILYSVNVFLTFSLSLTGLVRHGFLHRGERSGWILRLLVAVVALVVAVAILLTLTIAKFTHGAWVALLVAALFATAGYLTRRYYRSFEAAMARDFSLLLGRKRVKTGQPLPLNEPDPTGRPLAVLTSAYGSAGLHALLSAQALFDKRFDGILILSVGEVDAECYGGPEALKAVRHNVGELGATVEGWCRSHGLPAKVYAAFGTDAVAELEALCLAVRADYPKAVFVASRPIARPVAWFHSLLHGQTALTLQRRLHAHGLPLIVLPMLVDLSRSSPTPVR